MFDDNLKDELGLMAKTHGIDPATLLAVVEVESGGRLGAHINGRLEPLIRFEGHYFYRLLPLAKRNIAVVEGLASKKYGQVRNPFRQKARWKLLKRAEAIDQHAALSSCSRGCGQVMGAHWRWLGYASVEALVQEVRNGVPGQVCLMMRFIKKAGLIEKLQKRDWSGFARAYNGPAFRKLGYDSKLRNAYQHHRTTLYPAYSETGRPARNSMHILSFGSTGETVRHLQRSLSALGYPLQVDGDFGPATERMLSLFQQENQLDVDGVFGPASLEVMQRKLPLNA